MENSNKVLVASVVVALGCLSAVAIGFGWMQYVSFRNEQKEIARQEELRAQREVIEKVSTECRDMARNVNRTQDFIQAFEAEIQTFSENASKVKNLNDIKSAASQYTAAVDKVVSDLDGLAANLQDMSLEDETLIQFRADYTDVVQGFSTALQDARQAIPAKKFNNASPAARCSRFK
jgi:chromosome segregation ATPase